MIKQAAISLLLAIAFAGCASAPRPQGEYTAAQASVRGAEVAGARNEPRAAYHLKLATEQIAAAQREIAGDNMTAARHLLQRARADADLALLLTRRAQRRAQAQAALDRVSELERR